MDFSLRERLLSFLEQEMALPAQAIDLARRQEQPANLLPMVLWQYGLVNKEELNRIFDWLETV